MKFKNVMKRLRRSRRAVSPVIAVLLMIVIAVAASLFAYSWVSGYLDFLTVKVDQGVQVQTISWDNDTQTLTAYAQNVGPNDVNIANVYVDDVLDVTAKVYVPGTTDDDWNIPAGDTRMVVSTGIYTGADNQVTVKLTTEDGNIFMLKKTITTTTPGGGGSVITPPTVTQISSSDTGFGTVEPGDLLVVMPNHRTNTFVTDGETCTASGYTQVKVASYMDDTSDRRAVALLIKVAVGDEDGDTVTCTWGSGAGTYTTIYQIYRGATTWTPGESGVNHNGGTPPGNQALTVPSSPLSAGTTANILTIGALVTRDDPGTVTMSNLGSQDWSQSSNCYTFTDYSYGDAVTTTDITWTTNRLASGLLAQIACTD